MKKRIMIVDDSMLIAVEMQRMLRTSEFEVVQHCRTAEAALEAYGEIEPDLVTMDIILPGLDGIEATAHILSKWPNARVIMVSSMAHDDTIKTSGEMGVKDFLYKPFTETQLLASIRKALTD